MDKAENRCDWCGNNPIYVAYHDKEWGVPVNDDKKLFEFLILEGAQAGLSWLTVLKRREGYRSLFDEFDVEKVARFDQKRVEANLKNPAIIRNRLKVESAVNNAKKFITVQEEFGSFFNYSWRFVDGERKINRWKTIDDIPATTPESDAFSRDLKKRGFTFAGSTIIYAHMQATGMVNDHIVTCFRHSEV